MDLALHVVGARKTSSLLRILSVFCGERFRHSIDSVLVRYEAGVHGLDIVLEILDLV